MFKIFQLILKTNSVKTPYSNHLLIFITLGHQFSENRQGVLIGVIYLLFSNRNDVEVRVKHHDIALYFIRTLIMLLIWLVLCSNTLKSPEVAILTKISKVAG